MRKFHVLTNIEKDPELSITGHICGYLLTKGCDFSVQTAIHKGKLHPTENDIAGKDGIDVGGTFYRFVDDIPSDADCAIVLGGDGTMIQAADLIRGRKPLIGVNLGTLGFLQEFEASDVEEMIDALTSDEYEIEKRMMLSGFEIGDSSNSHIALNDVVISRKGSLKILYMNIYVNDKLLCNYKADGMVVSSPTGSTAYNLSAGGPIVEPSAEAILLTPICPHNLSARSIVLSPKDIVRVEVLPGRGDAEATFDGGEEIALNNGGSIQVAASEICTEIIKIGKEGFVEVLSRKIN